MAKNEIEMLEQELAARLGARDCPPLQLLRSLGGDALSQESRMEIETHLRACRLCRTLAADLQTDELSEPTQTERQRIVARVDAGIGAKRGRAPGRWAATMRPVLAAAALLVLIWGGWIILHRPETPEVTPRAPDQVADIPAPIPPSLRLEMPEVRLRAAIVLVTRGVGDSQQYLKDLVPALDAYRAGNYAAAVKEFSALEVEYPTAVEVLFYAGVSHLHEGAYGAAVEALEHAKTLDEREFADETAWYLGLAYHRVGNLGAAQEQFEKLCAASSEFTARACDAAQQLR